MKTRLLATVALLLAVRAAPAQERERMYSDPALPAREALDRLNLELVWRISLPMEGRRDSIVSIQHTGRQILAQTRGGVVSLFDAETARLVWRVRIGEPFRTAYPPAFNSTAVFAINGGTLFALDRSNGALQWQLNLPGGLAAPPLADEDQVYLFTGTGSALAYRPYTVEVPENVAPFAMPPSYGAIDVSAVKKREDERVIQVVRPLPVWDSVTRLRLELPAVQSPEMVLVPGPGGEVLGLLKYPREGYGPEAYRFPLETSLRAGPGALGNAAYFPGRDGHVYAFDMNKNRVLWRQLVSPEALTRTPVVTEQDLFVVSESGMARLDRETGNPLWRIPRGNRVVHTQAEADRFLAANPKFVYALDRSGRLVILDRARGLFLARFDITDYVVPVVNQQTDRLYLAANNGLILCLRDRDYPQPVRQRKLSDREREAGKTPEERAKELKDRLTQPVTLDAGDPRPLRQYLEDLRRMYGIKSFVSDEAYRKNMLPSPLDMKVKIPKVDKVPLSEVLQKVLEDVGSTFVPVGDQIFIIPKAKAALPPPPPAP
jgi:outer membrane protein assembly factor BamB